MFFGEPLNIARFDTPKYQIFTKLEKSMKSFFWNPEEINLEKDRTDFKGLTAHEKHIFTKNIAYQILLDSIQERAPITAFLPWISLPELEGCVIWWAAFEQIHSRSYQWILQNIYADPSVVFDSITTDDHIIQRAASIISYYDDFINYANLYRALGPGHHETVSYETDPVTGETLGNSPHEKEIVLSLYELKKKAYYAMFSVFALESVRFYVSFACSFAFGQQGKMKGNADIIRLIAKDESQHVGISVNVLKNWARKEGDPDFLKIVAEEEENVLKIFDDVVDQEKDWARYLFKDGSIIGLNETLLCKYLEYTANKRLKTLGYKPRYECTTDPFGWMSSWLSSEDTQVAPQEKEITDYLVNVLDTNVDEGKIIDF